MFGFTLQIICNIFSTLTATTAISFIHSVILDFAHICPSSHLLLKDLHSLQKNFSPYTTKKMVKEETKTTTPIFRICSWRLCPLLPEEMRPAPIPLNRLFWKVLLNCMPSRWDSPPRLPSYPGIAADLVTRAACEMPPSHPGRLLTIAARGVSLPV